MNGFIGPIPILAHVPIWPEWRLNTDRAPVFTMEDEYVNTPVGQMAIASIVEEMHAGGTHGIVVTRGPNWFTWTPYRREPPRPTLHPSACTTALGA